MQIKHVRIVAGLLQFSARDKPSDHVAEESHLLVLVGKRPLQLVYTIHELLGARTCARLDLGDLHVVRPLDALVDGRRVADQLAIPGEEEDVVEAVGVGQLLSTNLSQSVSSCKDVGQGCSCYPRRSDMRST